jgi:hypothetical protein
LNKKVKAAFLKLKNYDLAVIRNPSRAASLYFWISLVPALVLFFYALTMRPEEVFERSWLFL